LENRDETDVNEHGTDDIIKHEDEESEADRPGAGL
jgi:hypothetical protein